jgi:hypothetical protein
MADDTPTGLARKPRVKRDLTWTEISALTGLYENGPFSYAEAQSGAGHLWRLKQILRRKFCTVDEDGTWTITELGKTTYEAYRRANPIGA